MPHETKTNRLAGPAGLHAGSDRDGAFKEYVQVGMGQAEQGGNDGRSS